MSQAPYVESTDVVTVAFPVFVAAEVTAVHVPVVATGQVTASAMPPFSQSSPHFSISGPPMRAVWTAAGWLNANT